jgi:hypothetical protein
MPFLIIFVLAMISTGGNLIHSILIGIIGGSGSSLRDSSGQCRRSGSHQGRFASI